MYDRDYAGKTLNFEPSGGLMNASLVMQDQQTDTYWSIMTGEAEAGELNGTVLSVLPVGGKMQWEDWVARHPDTLVLSMTYRDRRGNRVTVQDIDQTAYRGYFGASEGYNGISATDDRLETKSPIYAFMEDTVKYAVEAESLVGGATFELHNGTKIFLYRAEGDEIFRGTAAFRSSTGFRKEGNAWIEVESGARFDAESREFGDSVERINGFDTFWYNWSLNNPDTELLR